VRDHLGTPDFVRVRIGIGRPRDEAVDHVLDRFSGSQRKELPELSARGADAVERVLEVGVERAMNEINTR
jgi:PTH1 family peptidyl-tRNA hydrolase